MKVIQTHYKGYYFRSRLEARWAVFFDAVDLEYRYEYEGYKLQNGLWYLPDFYLPEQGCYIEIKPGWNETTEEVEKVRGLAKDLGRTVFVCRGDVWLLEYNLIMCAKAIELQCCHWAECPACGSLGAFAALAGQFGPGEYTSSFFCLSKKCTLGNGRGWEFNVAVELNTPKLMNAYKAARSKRFEHQGD